MLDFQDLFRVHDTLLCILYYIFFELKNKFDKVSVVFVEFNKT